MSILFVCCSGYRYVLYVYIVWCMLLRVQVCTICLYCLVYAAQGTGMYYMSILFGVCCSGYRYVLYVSIVWCMLLRVQVCTICLKHIIGERNMRIFSGIQKFRSILYIPQIRGDKALTMTMTPWNLAHGQRSKNLTMAIDTLEFAPWSMVKYGIFRANLWWEFRSTILTMENLDFSRGHGQNFDHLNMVILKFRPWSWSKIFDYITMTPGRRPNGQKIVVALPPPN